jgi:hypothetical protein
MVNPKKDLPHGMALKRAIAYRWIPAFAGMTSLRRLVKKEGA